MPAKRRATSPAIAPAPKHRLSKLAKENNITAEEENEIKESFDLFAQKFCKSKEKLIPIHDVKKAMIAINLPPSPTELPEFLSILDSDSSGYASYEPFLAICALKLHSQSRSSESHASEVDEAFALFTAGSAQAKITKAGLQRVARMLNIEVEEQVLNDMILEANGGAGVGVGVERDEFEGVMRRAGVWR